jgi:hypothetical protein
MDDELVGMIERQELAELLDRQLGSGMVSRVRMQNTPRTDFHCDKDIQDAERSSHGNEKVTGHDGLCMIPPKVVQRRPELPRGPPRSRYLPTVRGETRMPNFSDNSSAIRPSPHVGFSRAMWRTSSQISFGSSGRPGLRDFHRQNILNALRCHLTNVSGFMIARAPCQSKNFARATIARRVGTVVRRGFALRSRNRAGCFLRNKFSATRAARLERNNRMNVSNSVFYKSLSALLMPGPNFCGPHDWDDDLLALEIQQIQAVDFDLGLTGFSIRSWRDR